MYGYGVKQARGVDLIMDRAEFNNCLAKGLAGRKMDKETRRIEFCTLAKLCSGKVKTRDEALLICSQPKEPKAVKARRQSPDSCEKDVLSLSHCMAERIDMSQASNVNSIETAIVNAMIGCRCRE